MGEKICFVRPDTEHEQDVTAYAEAFALSGENMDGSAGLSRAASYKEWIGNIALNSSKNTVLPGLVPASTYLVYNEEKYLVGFVDIRHELNDFLFASGGHIGYSVHPAFRRMGYATNILKLALLTCKQELKMTKVLITCNGDNVGSRKTIEANGGILENSVCENGVETKRYWIELGTL